VVDKYYSPGLDENSKSEDAWDMRKSMKRDK